MNFLFAGTLIVWVAILGYVITLFNRQNQLARRLDDLERR